MISSQVRTKQYVSPGGVVPVALGFPFAAVTDIVVTTQDGDAAPVTLTLNVHYSIGGTLAQWRAGTGTLVPIAIAAGLTVRAERRTALQQKYNPVGGIALDHKALGVSLDDTVMRAQDAGGIAMGVEGRALMVSPGQTPPRVGSLDDSDGKALGIVDGVIVPVANDVAGAEQIKADVEVLAGQVDGDRTAVAADRVATEAARDEASDAAIAAAAAAFGAKFRAHPNAVFNWLPIYARADAPGVAEVSEHIDDYAKRVHVGLIGAGVVYVDPVNGNDANSGPITTPVQTLNNALRTKNPSQVYLIGSNNRASPRVFRKSDFRSTDTPGNKLKIVTAIGHCVIEEDGPQASAQTWTSTGGVYDTTPTLVGGVAPHCIEYKGWLRPDGQPFRLRKCANSADIGVTGGGVGWAWDGTKIYLRVGNLNIETNKADFKITYSDATSRCLIYGGVHILFEVGPGSSLVFNGVQLAPLQLAGARPRIYARGIEIRNCFGHGLDAGGAYYAFEDCFLFANQADNFHPADSGGVSTLAFEINCTSREAGDFDTFGLTAGGTNNGSSMHGLGSVARYGGFYTANGGPNIVDTGTGKSWNLGIKTDMGRATANGFGFYAVTGTVEMWLDTCHAGAEPTMEIRAENGCIIHQFRTTSKRRDTVGTGVINDYTPVAA